MFVQVGHPGNVARVLLQPRRIQVEAKTKVKAHDGVDDGVCRAGIPIGRWPGPGARCVSREPGTQRDGDQRASGCGWELAQDDSATTAPRQRHGSHNSATAAPRQRHDCVTTVSRQRHGLRQAPRGLTQPGITVQERAQDVRRSLLQLRQDVGRDMRAKALHTHG